MADSDKPLSGASGGADWERFLTGDVSAAELTAARRSHGSRVSRFAALTALVVLDRMDEFEDELDEALESGIAADEALDILLELADHGIPVPDRAFRLVRSRMFPEPPRATD